MDHEPRRRGAVPVVLAGLQEDPVPGTDGLDRAAVALAEPDAFGDEDRLTVRCVCQAVRAPGVKCTSAAENVELPAGAAIPSM